MKRYEKIQKMSLNELTEFILKHPIDTIEDDFCRNCRIRIDGKCPLYEGCPFEQDLTVKLWLCEEVK